MTHVEDVLLHALAQKGDKYVFGAEAAPTDPDPSKFDCSELVEWACARAKVAPKMPDGAYYQWVHSAKNHNGTLTVIQGIRTRGALLFTGDGTGVGRDAITHVAWSLGDGTTIEARGSRWGVGMWNAHNRFNFAALMPGVEYGAKRQPAPPKANGYTKYPGGVWRNGARHSFVRTIQHVAVLFGCDIGRHGEDGIFGRDTEAAVECVQSKSDGKLRVDGEWGPATQKWVDGVFDYLAALAAKK